jgi:hypothetical protein
MPCVLARLPKDPYGYDPTGASGQTMYSVSELQDAYSEMALQCGDLVQGLPEEMQYLQAEDSVGGDHRPMSAF